MLILYRIIPKQAVPVYTDPVPPSTSQYRLTQTAKIAFIASFVLP